MFIAADTKNKLIKRLNDLNQDVKYLYDEYYLFTDTGIITSDDEHDLSSNGNRMTVSLIEFPEFNGICIKLISKDIYTIIKEHKKEIAGVLIEDSKIYFIGSESRWNVGEVCETDKPDSNTIKSLYKILENFKELSSDDVIEIVNNGMIILEYNGIKANTTKDLIPGVKKNDKVMYNFTIDKSSDGKLATLYIYHEKSKKSIYTIHTYPILII